MTARRILSLWFPHLAAEHALRSLSGLAAGTEAPFAVTDNRNGTEILLSLCPMARAAGLLPGLRLADARARVPDLRTRARDRSAETACIAALQRWAGRFSPWVATEGPAAGEDEDAQPGEGLVLDITGCAHLFGGEEAMARRLAAECATFGLTVRAGLADTRGAAWALARYAGTDPGPTRDGDAIDQEARATRSRAFRLRPGLRGAQVAPPERGTAPARALIAPSGQTRAALAPLPLAALRLPEGMAGDLAALGLRHVADLVDMPRAALARRFGQTLLLRLDQALGLSAEPVGAVAEAPRFSLRLTFPEPADRLEDMRAALDRLLPALGARLVAAGRGARRLLLEARATDGTMRHLSLGCARPLRAPEDMRPLLELRLETLDPGPGIDMLRLSAPLTEPMAGQDHRGPGGRGTRHGEAALDDLLGRIGARLGAEAMTRLHPADSHLPEKAAAAHAALYAPAHDGAWPAPPAPRPPVLWRPEPAMPAADPPRPGHPPAAIRWRRATLSLIHAEGPERIAPEWWLDLPEWRNGPRDYWRVETGCGRQLWLFKALGGAIPGGWFVQGDFG